MSKESTTPDVVGLTRALLEAAKHHDLDAYMAFFAPDAAFDLSDLGIGTFEGAAAIRGFIEDWWGTWGNHRSEVEEIADLGHGVVSAHAWEEGRLAGSEGHVEIPERRIADLKAARDDFAHAVGPGDEAGEEIVPAGIGGGGFLAGVQHAVLVGVEEEFDAGETGVSGVEVVVLVVVLVRHPGDGAGGDGAAGKDQRRSRLINSAVDRGLQL